MKVLIVGAGLAGSVIAERLAKQGHKITVIDKRYHVGGNCYDYYNKQGVLVHKYGPHCIWTEHQEVYDYLDKFTEFREYEYRFVSDIDGQIYPMPINRDTLNLVFKTDLKTEEEANSLLELLKVKIDKPANSRDLILSRCGIILYELFVEGYTTKQWGVSPEHLDPCVCGRVGVRPNTDSRYTTRRIQVMPKEGYTAMFNKMLDHANINIVLKTDYKEWKGEYDLLIYTGTIDGYFDYEYGRLPYRSLNFEHKTYKRDLVQPAMAVYYPSLMVPYTRSVEIKYATGQVHPYTTVVREYPVVGGEDPYYPIPSPDNTSLYDKYRVEADKLGNVIFVGRLAEYKYYYMDEVILRALEVADGIVNIKNTK